MNLVRDAIEYATHRHFPVFPVDIKKRPCTPRGFHDASLDPVEIERMWARASHASGIGVATGKQMGAYILDVDGDLGKYSLEALEYEYGDLPETLTATTCSSGKHIYFRHPGGEIKSSVSKLAPGLDIRADGGYGIAPPSVALSKNDGKAHPYFWDVEADIAQCDWLDRLVSGQTSQTQISTIKNPGAYLSKCCDLLEAMPADSGRNQFLNNTAFKIAPYVKSGALCLDDFETKLTEAALRSGLETREIEATIRSAYNAAPVADEPPPPPPGRALRLSVGWRYSEAAQLFLEHSDPRMRWHEGWWVYNGSQYAPHSEEQARTDLYTFLEGLQVPVMKKNKKTDMLEHTGDYSKFRVDTKHMSNIKDALLAYTPRSTTGAPFYVDSDTSCTELIPLLDGAMNAETGEISHPGQNLFTPHSLQINSEDLPGACPRWHQFLDEVFDSDIEARLLLQEWMGYILTPDTSHQKILLIWGPPGSGKGVVQDVMRNLLGPSNCCGPTLNSLARDFGLESIIGKNLAIIPDARFRGGSDSQSEVVEKLLSLSGGDAIDINRKNRPAVTMVPTARLVIMSNELPRLSDTSNALSRRIIPLRFAVSFVSKADPGLTHKLKTELPGIFTWALKGLNRLRKRGYFEMPESSKEDLETLQELASPMLGFLEKLEFGPELFVEVQTLFDYWKDYCDEIGQGHPGSINNFGRGFLAACMAAQKKVSKARRGSATTDRVRTYVGVSFERARGF